MADAVLFPGTEMEVFEKYPGSRRLDHPNFTDVGKTTFATMGVISEFQEGECDDPESMVVNSMVKVEVGGVESDFIPIFFHPKAQYWDGQDGVLATDFDPEVGFKKAFMSFRAGDEVVVMLKEGVPVAVLGFADGKPRVGENIFKVTWEKWNGESHFSHIQSEAQADIPPRESDGGTDWSEYGEIDVVPNGPDGVDLGLALELSKLCETAVASYGSGGLPHSTYTHYLQYQEYLIQLGGKAYIFQIMDIWEYVVDPFGATSWHYYGISIYVLGAVDKKDLIESTKELGEVNSSLSARDIRDGVYSGPGGVPPYLTYPGFKSQLNPGYGFVDPASSYYNIMFPGSWTGENITKGSTIKIYVRPHTKEEMQAAGLWPEG